MSYSDEQLLTEIRRLADELDRPPTLQEMRTKGEYAVMTYYDRFGSWRDALEAAGFEAREPDQKISREDLLSELQRVAAEQDIEPPTASAMNEEGAYWASTYRRRFGSWNAAVKAAGFDPTQTTVTDADLLVELRRLAENQDEPPTYTDMSEQGKYAAATYVRRFGSWNAALEAAELTPRTSTDLSREELCIALQQLAEALDHRPSAREMDEHGEYASATYQRRFGSWSEALDYCFETDTDAHTS